MILLINIRSVRQHSDDIKADPILFNSDVIALTETQLPEEIECNNSALTISLLNIRSKKTL